MYYLTALGTKSPTEKNSQCLQHHLQHFGQLLTLNEPEDVGTGTLIMAPPFNWLLPP
ncbi:hypothetical protein LEMLEM_LOCUS6490 [Lemmus lemmus]